MDRCGLVTVLAVVLASTGAIAQQDTVPPDAWSFLEFPNPFLAADREKCGGHTDRHTYICDPNHLIPIEEASQINMLIEQVMNETVCPCSTNVCEAPGSRGYRIEVALMKSIKADENDPVSKDPLKAALQKSEKFARETLRRWNNRRCNEDTIIVYALQDNVMYTFVGNEASRKLDRFSVADIQMKLRGYFTPNGNLFEGLRHLISSYKAVYLGTYKGLDYKYQTPRYEPVIGGAGPVTAIAIVTSLATLVASLFCSGPLF